MTSDKKIAASRVNGKKSRGPRTLAGKSRASRNALRHGLAIITRDNPAIFPEIERIAVAICGGDTNPLLFEQALMIAESEIVLRCVRAERVCLIERLRDPAAEPLAHGDNRLALARARFNEAKAQYGSLVQAAAERGGVNRGEAKVESAGESNEMEGQSTEKNEERETLRDEFEAMHQAMPDLNRLVRYERRAFSRRKRAIRDFIEIKAREGEGLGDDT
jgi:hypothetical protein